MIPKNENITSGLTNSILTALYDKKTKHGYTIRHWRHYLHRQLTVSDDWQLPRLKQRNSHGANFYPTLLWIVVFFLQKISSRAARTVATYYPR